MFLSLHLPQHFVSNFLQFVSASQPLNALAYIFDGLHYGVSDFPFAAISMVSNLYKNGAIIKRKYELCTDVSSQFVDDRGCSLFSVSALCYSYNWSSGSLVGFDYFHGIALCGWFHEVI